ncbi:MAG: hypothetical protein ABIM99_00875 [Candidatus Dojkabacteria bacterium]
MQFEKPQNNIITDQQIIILKKRYSELLDLIKEFKPDLIVFLSFSASPFEYLPGLGSINSVHLNIGNKNSKVIIDNLEKDPNSKEKLKKLLENKKRVLIIDDIIYSGQTQLASKSLLLNLNHILQVEYFAFIDGSNEGSNESLPFWETEDGVSGVCLMPWKIQKGYGRVNLTDRTIDPEFKLFTKISEAHDPKFEEIKQILSGF